jgi:hypothetical protein
MAQNPTSTQLLEVSLTEPVRQGRHMVHMGMAQAHRSSRQHRSGAQSHVECEIKFRDVHHRFLASDADALDAVRRNEEEAHLPLAGRRLWNHVESPVAALSRG